MNSHRLGEPFVGPSGHLLMQMLREAGFDPARVFKTNIVRCAGTTPKMPHVRKCRAYTLNELADLDYSHCQGVLLLGETAVRGFLNNGGLTIKAARLRALEGCGGPDLPVPVRATYHPAAALPGRNPALYDEIVGDIRTMWKTRQPVAPVQVVESLQALDHAFSGKEVIGFDLEWWTDTGRLRMAGVSDGSQSLVLYEPILAVNWIIQHREEK